MKKHLPSGWKEVRLGDICEYFRGLSYNKQNVVDFGLLVLRSNNIQNYNIDLSDDELQFVNKNCNDDILLKKHDIVICMANGTKKLVGKSAEYKGNYKGKITIGAFCGLLRTKNVLLKYILQTKVYRDYIGIILAGTNINNLRSSELLDFTFQIPTSIDEQKRIAEILSTFDDLIENLTKLIEKKEIYKKGVMQRVLTGKVRFNGFTDEWKTMRIGDICEYKNGNSFENYIDENGKLFLITLDSITIDGRLKNNHKKINIDTKELLSKNDIVMILSDIAHGYFLGLTAVIDKDNCYVLNQRVALLKPNNIIVNSYFLSKLININQKYFKKYGQGSSQQNLQKKSVENFIVKIPSLEEQNKIAELLTLIDKDIDNLKQILQLRKLQKKGVMQKLLTGEVRV